MSVTPDYAATPTDAMRQLQGLAAQELTKRNKTLDRQFKRLNKALAEVQDAELKLGQINAVLALRDSLGSEYGDLSTEIAELHRRVAAGTVEITRVRNRKNAPEGGITIEVRDADGWHRRLTFAGFLTVRNFLRGLDPRITEGHKLVTLNHEDDRPTWRFEAANGYDLTIHGKLTRVEGVRDKKAQRRAA